MSIKYVVTFSNCTKKGIIAPERVYGISPLEYVTKTLADSAKLVNDNLDNCTAYSVCGMYKGIPETSYRLEYILSAPISGFFGYVEWIRQKYEQESVLLEVYCDNGYKSFLVYGLHNVEEL